MGGKLPFTWDYKKKRIQIAFNPIEEKFEVSNAAVQKDAVWVSDISLFFQKGFQYFSFIQEYHQKKPDLVSPEETNRSTPYSAPSRLLYTA